MISWYRVAAIAPGKTASAIRFAHEISAFVKGKTGADTRIAMPIGGNPNRKAPGMRSPRRQRRDEPSIRITRKSLSLVSVGPVTTESPGASKKSSLSLLHRF